MKSREKTCRILAAAAVALLASTGCGPVDESSVPPEPGHQQQAQASDNGLSFNGLSFNGLSFNGLSFNGLSFNGLNTSAFQDWFQENPVMADLVMRYVVRCAVPAGQTRTYTSPATGQQYTWSGGLGLAPAWAAGSVPTEAEQQVVSACLAAHANRMEESVSISVLGRDAQGNTIPLGPTELSSHSRREACFFGNLFRGEGVYVGAEREPLGPSESTSRACGALLYGGSESVMPCSPLTFAGACTSRCTLDASGNAFTSCTWNGKSYLPLTTRVRTEDVHKCGDAKCQNTERCGTTYQYDSCELDCGPCQ